MSESVCVKCLFCFVLVACPSRHDVTGDDKDAALQDGGWRAAALVAVRGRAGRSSAESSRGAAAACNCAAPAVTGERTTTPFRPLSLHALSRRPYRSTSALFALTRWRVLSVTGAQDDMWMHACKTCTLEQPFFRISFNVQNSLFRSVTSLNLTS